MTTPIAIVLFLRMRHSNGRKYTPHDAVLSKKFRAAVRLWACCKSLFAAANTLLLHDFSTNRIGTSTTDSMATPPIVVGRNLHRRTVLNAE